MRRSMDWTLEENMVDGLFFCVTLTELQAAEGPVPNLCKEERKCPTPVRWRLSRTDAVLGRAIQEGDCRYRG